jgi:hypothetical protein
MAHSLHLFLLNLGAVIVLILPLEWTFNADLVGGLPAKWEARGGSAKGIYQIEAEANGNRYLAARSRGSDVQLGTEVAVKPQEHPTLSWRWRVWELPRNADERKLQTLDSAASVYAVFGSRLFPRVLKYVWSSSAPVGSAFKHPRSGRMAIIVVASGGRSLREWQTITRNIVEDYKLSFGSEPGELIAIGVKTDSDSTSSSARADYDDLRLGPR